MMKDKSVAGILALFLGMFGVHRFYLEQTGLGIFYLMFCWLPIIWVVGWIDAIVFLSMDKENFDYKYNRRPNYRSNYRQSTDFERKNYRRYDRQERREERTERRDYRREQRQQQQQRPKPAPTYHREPVAPKRNNPFKISGIKKYKEYDYDGAIEDFEKALEIEPQNVAVHFNLACSYSLNERADKAFYHLDKAVAYGFNDFRRIKEHDALAFLRIQDKFEEFEQNGFRSTQQQQSEQQQIEAPKEDLLSTNVNLLDQLKKLGELREKGLLTEEEFSIQKKKLLR